MLEQDVDTPQRDTGDSTLFDEWYLPIGYITGAIAFFWTWSQFIGSWGIFLGILFGWVPSLFIAVVIGLAWPLIVTVVAVIILHTLR